MKQLIKMIHQNNYHTQSQEKHCYIEKTLISIGILLSHDNVTYAR